ncbi:hypothetical protein ACQ4LE_000338 [Meloidogyne hapla]
MNLKQFMIDQGNNFLELQTKLLDVEMKMINEKEEKDALELKVIQMEEKTQLLEKELRNSKSNLNETQAVKQVLQKMVDEKFNQINRSMETKIQQIKNENSEQISSLKKIIQLKDEHINSLEETLTKSNEEIKILKKDQETKNQEDTKTDQIIQSFGVYLNELDQECQRRFQTIEQNMGARNNKLETQIEKIDKIGLDQSNKIDEIEKTIQNLIDEKAKEKTDKKFQHLQIQHLQTEFNKNISELRNEFFILHQNQVEKINKMDESNNLLLNIIKSMEVELKYLNNSTFKRASFVSLENKWKFIDDKWPCCGNACVKTDTPNVNCNAGNGYIKLTEEGNIKYIKCREGKANKFPSITAENQFTN